MANHQGAKGCPMIGLERFFTLFMIEEQKMTTETTVTPEEQAKQKRIAELSAKMAAGVAKDPAFLASAEGQKLIDEMGSLTSGKKKKAAADPALTEEKESLKVYLFGEEGEENGGAQGTAEERLNATLKEKYPLLAAKGAAIEVRIRLKGAGKGSGEGRSGAPRVLHREEGGRRSKALNEQGLPSVKVLVEAYPDEAEEIQKIFGSADNRRKLWEESGHDTSKAYLTLSDGSKLCLQS